MSRPDPAFWAGKRVLLTGHTGFKGSWAGLWLARMGAEVTGLALAPDQTPALADLLQLDDAGFRALFSKSPIKRIGRDRFVRNCLLAAGNSGEGALLAQVEPLLADPDPVVAEAAQWAAERLAPLSSPSPRT